MRMILNYMSAATKNQYLYKKNCKTMRDGKERLCYREYIG